MLARSVKKLPCPDLGHCQSWEVRECNWSNLSKHSKTSTQHERQWNTTALKGLWLTTTTTTTTTTISKLRVSCLTQAISFASLVWSQFICRMSFSDATLACILTRGPTWGANSRSVVLRPPSWRDLPMNSERKMLLLKQYWAQSFGVNLLMNKVRFKVACQVDPIDSALPLYMTWGRPDNCAGGVISLRLPNGPWSCRLRRVLLIRWRWLDITTQAKSKESLLSLLPVG